MAVGPFDYDQRGPLDHGHVRFFTRRSFERLVDECGLRIVERRPSVPRSTCSRAAATAPPRAGWPSGVARADRAATRAWPTMFGYQFLYRLETSLTDPRPRATGVVESRPSASAPGWRRRGVPPHPAQLRRDLDPDGDTAIGYASNFFDLQARAFLDGQLAVPARRLGIEGFVVDGRELHVLPSVPGAAAAARADDHRTSSTGG